MDYFQLFSKPSPHYLYTVASFIYIYCLNLYRDWLHNYIGIATHLGLRSGAIIGLKWFDIHGTTITIQRTKDFNRDTSPKTASSNRELALFESVLPFIDGQRRLSKDFEYIFIKKNGTP